MMGAMMLKVPELNLSPEEAKKLAEGMAKVASYYDVGASEKTLAWVNLAVCAGGIYGTRAFAYHLRLKAEADSKKQIAAATQAARSDLSQTFPAQAAA